MPWRYQPVYQLDDDGQALFSVIECYFDDEDRLTKWTDLSANEVAPTGDGMAGLSKELVHMLCDTWKWKPVLYDKLKPGMEFERTGVSVEPMIAAMEAAMHIQ